MRLWTIHPNYLDPQGLVALWREGLLAQKVLRGLTRGYTAHPQLVRFQAQPDPMACIASYLHGVHEEAVSRGYEFDASKIARGRTSRRLTETSGQLRYEWEHLKRKLQVRHAAQFELLARIKKPDAHPLFRIVSGNVRDWERIPEASS
ncbi:MAG: DNA lyase [Planctomycetales bacterium]|nr:DNA lyase [Planctomycetales bacterium]